MARREGFEPPTAWFEARNSIQLSYRRPLDNKQCRNGKRKDGRDGRVSVIGRWLYWWVSQEIRERPRPSSSN